MSDDENEVSYYKKDKVVHYGSFEEHHQNVDNDSHRKTFSAIEAGIAAGNINISDGLHFSVVLKFSFTFGVLTVFSV